MDTGTSSTIVLRNFVAKGRAKGYAGKSTTWSTLGGKFKTKHKALIDFTFPELNNQKAVTWICQVDEKHAEEESCYDMIISMDLMTSIGIYVDTSTKEVKWEGHAIPLKQCGDLQSKEMVQHIYHISQQPTIITEAEECQSCILDSDYSSVDINERINELKHLNLEDKKLLKEMLNRHT